MSPVDSAAMLQAWLLQALYHSLGHSRVDFSEFSHTVSCWRVKISRLLIDKGPVLCSTSPIN
jgi:hypothetical protein